MALCLLVAKSSPPSGGGSEKTEATDEVELKASMECFDVFFDREFGLGAFAIPYGAMLDTSGKAAEFDVKL